MTYLQIALDFTSMTKALDLVMAIFREVRDRRVWFEVGTPLIKSWGLIPVRLIKEATNMFVVADTKTIDAAELEIGEAFKSGADAATVLGLADDSTIRAGVELAKTNGKTLIVDLIGVQKPYERAVQVYSMGPDYVLFHIGVDVQRARGLTAVELVKEAYRFKRETGGRYCIAGGIKLEDVDRLLEAEPDVIVVGGAITRSSNPVKTVLDFLEKLPK
ncbi:orotidine 5'-phosphate decarboxylase / HUMPS family protein [Thermogladius sp.]|uniref:orotidine 5'-phosphate decarboxylase / HUMPS family protein n=1 Tax=Thermogladius sp. TaxID=2023064 RepID=UPI003D12175A